MILLQTTKVYHEQKEDAKRKPPAAIAHGPYKRHVLLCERLGEFQEVLTAMALFFAHRPLTPGWLKTIILL